MDASNFTTRFNYLSVRANKKLIWLPPSDAHAYLDDNYTRVHKKAAYLDIKTCAFSRGGIFVDALKFIYPFLGHTPSIRKWLNN